MGDDAVTDTEPLPTGEVVTKLLEVVIRLAAVQETIIAAHRNTNLHLAMLERGETWMRGTIPGDVDMQLRQASDEWLAAWSLLAQLTRRLAGPEDA